MFRQILTGKLKGILILSAIVQFLGLCIFVLAFVQQQRIMETNVLDKFSTSVGYLENEMIWSADCMEELCADAAILRTDLRYRDLDHVNKLGEMRRIFYILRTVSGRAYNFFLYSTDDGGFVELTTVETPFPDYLPIRTYLTEQLGKAMPTIWTLETVNGQDIVFYYHNYGSFCVGTWIFEDAMLAQSNAEDGYYAELIPYRQDISDRSGFFPFTEKKMAYRMQDSTTNFLVQMTMPADGLLVGMTVIQLIQLLIWLQVLVVLVFFAAAINRNLLHPMKNLQTVLEKYHTTDFQEPEPCIRETIDDAYAILGALGEQVNSLSAELYEKELEMKRVALNFRNLQIRPHFIINCFAMISGMAQMNDTDEIKRVLVELADYFRYILHDSMDMVTLEEEIAHIRCLIQIRSRISNNSIVFHKKIEAGLENEQIPVLLLATLAENSIRCAHGDDREIQLLLQIRMEDGYLQIDFTDNGPGMDPQLMEAASAGNWNQEDQGMHIGISNLLKRLSLIYGARATIRFTRDDQELLGTRVTICIRWEDDHETANS